MAKSFKFEIVTPEKLFYLGEAELVIARTVSGDEGFMANHCWAFKLLGTGELRFREAGEKEFKLAAISGGFVDVSDNVIIYTDYAEWADEIDLERANMQRERELEWLESHQSQNEDTKEIAEHKSAAQRAANRQKIAAGKDRQRH